MDAVNVKCEKCGKTGEAFDVATTDSYGQLLVQLDTTNWGILTISDVEHLVCLKCNENLNSQIADVLNNFIPIKEELVEDDGQKENP